ncbi:NAD+ synthase [Rhodobacter capsulatus]|uniref:Glutamine-dependent NAD(+) synthetase n=2 Tax=Rhodobacter capsulatus TaxID=1061 RepID=NADE_RHOCA|nr:NAD+ synthase [Rhodobacter capsulatus]Q03638.1 RecName: Full=Glutamine-dependent NAD(+) synthetase; AltName: Full=NAD(+) synthase [glutamine-hydrolyzing] [Rhodobacter capsulatus]ADE85112.1 NAD(+) synthase (glutamine-hydrolyzing) [Rhodobacter capsulatus SB 1003]ETD02121.1 NAD synthetase [Rhodobacter capsulatus DE442]ETD77795.1 NAD synthetase [Rhodobacter capsulatus R121]ETE54153.1 NAD synthetase [Rhodobacter capsulatus Y262]MDS0926767.1 NAD+ synthase [Rhodobacter capsulatus]
MTDRFRITLAQLNPTVGALAANAEKAMAAWQAGRAAGADLVALPEMFLTGYQTQDLVLKPAFLRDAMAAMAALAAQVVDGPALGIGGPYVDETGSYNAWWVLKDGRVIARALKHHLPHDDVFDEMRLFDQGPVSDPLRLGPVALGVPVCEDAWHPDVAGALAAAGAEVLMVPNGSPYRRGKLDLRRQVTGARVAETGLPLLYLNMVGGQDDQLFDGASFVLNPDGSVAVQLPAFEEAVVHVDLERGAADWRAVPADIVAPPGDIEQDYRAMVLGLQDYLRKSGFSRVVLGLSGGIDSALVAVIAADALGAGNVHCVMLPSRYTSQGSLDDAADLARRLGARLDTVEIEGPRAAVEGALAHVLAGTAPDVTEENIQSRLRGVILMAISNKFGAMLLTTGNKSEVAVGYCTIYGDMAGGYNPLKDLYKTRVFETCRWRNATHRPWMQAPAGEIIPVAIIDKPPSAELRENQTDQDSLPPYEVLDAILERLVEGDQSVDQIVAAGFDRATVKRIEHLLYISEWKRFQSAPGPRLTTRAFWLDRRYPMVNRWRDQS